MKKYALLYFQQINDIFSKWIFPLHDGENIIGSDEDADIFLYLNENEDVIESCHCKIIVNEAQNEVGIISLALNGNVKRGEKENQIILRPGTEYELNNKSIFYLTNNAKFTLIKGTLEEIHNFCTDEGLENEFQQWHQFILTIENNIKINLNLSKKDLNNNSFISNNNENNISEKNNSILLNSAVSNHNLSLNPNVSNSILGSNIKEVNRIGFNNFDEVPEDNIINDKKIQSYNPINLGYNNSIKSIKNPLINISPLKPIKNQENQNNESNNNTPVTPNNKNNSFNFKLNQISSEIININNNIINEKETELNSMKSEIKEDNYLINNNNKQANNNSGEHSETKNENYNDNKANEDDYSNPFVLFKQSTNEFRKNSFCDEKQINNDETALQILRELLGENDLEKIINNKNNKEMKKYDKIIKKSRQNKNKDLMQYNMGEKIKNKND